jgi:hypothetical protein
VIIFLGQPIDTNSLCTGYSGGGGGYGGQDQQQGGGGGGGRW